MRVKEILRTATQAWSPAPQHPARLALGTAAQQLDASFNTSSALEIFEVDFADTSLDMKLRGTLPTSNRFHSLIWVAFDPEGLSGRLIGGSESGSVTVFSPDAILGAGEDAVIGQSHKHTGPVRALDYNRFQSNLVASGASDSEIYIWDLNNFSNPMTPGTKAQPAEDVSVVAWNSQVQHILASANPSGKAIVWDLRKNEPIIKISDHSNRMHCSGMLWHPDVATQLVLASEDDRLPVIQMWDLRFATSPLKVLESHTRGILSISWSQADPELLLSSGKDNRILCWNPNTGEVIYELPTANQWCFDVQWCPRNPALLSAASFDGRISVYSVMGGRLQHSDPFGTGQTLPPLQVPQPSVETTIVPPLKKPPKWVRRPVGASFAFGGKLVTFENPSVAPQQQQPIARQVQVSQVTTETEFLQRSAELQAALQSGSFTSFCHDKIRSAPSDAEQDIWRFLTVQTFTSTHNYNSTCDLNPAAQKQSSVSPADFFSQLPKKEKDRAPFQIPVSSDTDGLISQALLVGNFEGAVDLCLNDGRYAEAILLSISGGEELLKKTQQHYLQRQTNSLISSVVTQNWCDIVQSCELDNWKEALAALLTYANPEEFAPLCDTLGSRLQAGGTEKRCLQACLCFICSGNIERLVECWTSQRDCSSPLALEDLVEKVMVLRKSIERLRNGEVCVQSSALTERLVQYSSILASQGSLTSALRYLPDCPDQVHTLIHIYICVPASGSLGAPMVPPSSPPGPMMPAPPAPGFLSPTSLPGGPVPLFPVAAPGGAYLPLGAGYPQGGPGAPGAKSFSGAGVPPPPTGTCRRLEEPLNTASLQQLPAEHVGQKEIPAEHMILKTTFSSLVQRCQLAAADPQTKRKLDDASKRLESLYDKLRDQALSPSILGGLHEISRCVSARNYQQGLEVHTQVVSSSNFSEISAFMPVLKVLMTIANKLAV
uniref:Protein transport protein Sec31A n=1 Tax=Cyprinus carpio TaxID=7962 RepID=A0A8C2A455_CYPCA